MRVVASLALVKSSMDLYKKDYIENFLPFIATLVTKNNFSVIELSNLSVFIEKFKTEFGLNIPYHPMSTILDRARKRGLFKKEQNRLFPIKNVIMQYDITGKIISKESEYNKIISEFANFCKNEYEVTISDKEANEIFLSYLQRYDLNILFASEDRTLIPVKDQSRSKVFLLASFINFIRAKEPLIFKSVLDVAIGHVLASCILYNDNLLKFTGKLQGIEIYFDCHVLFNLMGINGEEKKDAYKEFITVLNNQGAKLFIFKHTYEEVLKILNNALHWIDNPLYSSELANSVASFFREKSMSKSDAELFILSLDEILRTYAIPAKNSPDFFKGKENQIDEDKLKKIIVGQYSQNNEKFDELEKGPTIDKDIKSISAIRHLRKGQLPRTLKEAGHIFITTNFSLAYASKIFESEINPEIFFIPSCLTDFFLGTIVWMQSPVKLVSLNEKRFIASCYSALQPCGLFVKKIVEECKKLLENKTITEDIFRILTESEVAKELLMHKTLGDPDRFTPKTVQETMIELTGRARKEPEEKALKKEAENKKLKSELQHIKDKNELMISRIVLLSKKISEVIILPLPGLVWVPPICCGLKGRLCFKPSPLLDKGQDHRSRSRLLLCSVLDFGIHMPSSLPSGFCC